jgi:UDP-glucose 4-epimerase
MKVLVVGGAGFLGSVVVDQLCRARHDVTVCDNLSTGNAWAAPAEAHFVRSDIADRRSIDQVMGGGYDAVAHLAGPSHGRASRNEPIRELRANVGGSLELLESMRKHGVRRLVFVSSAAVYGGAGGLPVPESAPLAPATPYGLSMAAVERAIGHEATASSLSALTLRLFNLAGACGPLGEWHHPETHLMPAALQVAAGVRDSIPVYGTDHDTPDGTAIRDFVHVSDAARACLLALEAPAEPGHRVYNVGTGTGHSVRAVLRAARDVSGFPIPTVDARRRSGDQSVLTASTDRARRELGWVAQHSGLDEMVEDTWAFLRGHLGCRAGLGSVLVG